MKQERFDIKLREKLGHLPVEPPADMWARIEQGLGAAASGGAQSGDVGTAKVKPLRRRIPSWSYAAAAFLLAGVLSLGVLLRTREELPTIAQREDTESIRTEAVVPPSDLGQGELVAEAAVSGSTRNEPNGPSATPSREAISPAYSGTKTAPETESGESRPATPAETESGDTGPATPERTENGISAPQDSDTDTHTDNIPPVKENRDKTSDMKQAERPAAIDTRIPRFEAEDNARSKRRRTPITTSLFAANFGGINLSGDVLGTTRVENDEGSDTGVALKLRHRMPLTVGVNVSYGLTDNLSIETGLQYTFLFSDTDSEAGSGFVCKQKVHYLGIPLSVRYDFFNRRAFKLYAGLGGAIDKCIEAKQFDKFTYNLPSETTKLSTSGFQYSVNMTLGIQAEFSRTVGFYVEPGLNYFFDAPNQPESYRTQNPLSFSVKAGFRFNLR